MITVPYPRDYTILYSYTYYCFYSPAYPYKYPYEYPHSSPMIKPFIDMFLPGKLPWTNHCSGLCQNLGGALACFARSSIRRRSFSDNPRLGLERGPNPLSCPFLGWEKYGIWVVYPICSMYGIFTYKTGWFWTRANVGIHIPAPSFAYGYDYSLFWWRYRTCKDHGLYRDLMGSSFPESSHADWGFLVGMGILSAMGRP